MRITLSQQDIAQLAVAHVRQLGFVADVGDVVIDIEEVAPTGIAYAPGTRIQKHRVSVLLEVTKADADASPPSTSDS